MMTIKGYLYTLLGFVVGGLMIAVKVLTTKNSQLSRKLETADAKVHHAKVVNQKRNEHEEEFRSRSAEIAKEIEDTKKSSELEDPNKW